jgi:hypothetical protein
MKSNDKNQPEPRASTLVGAEVEVLKITGDHVDNKAGTIRFSAFFSSLLSYLLALNIGNMCRLGYKGDFDNTTSTFYSSYTDILNAGRDENISPTMVTFTVAAALVAIYSTLDVITTWKETNTKLIFPWDTQHHSFKRSMSSLSLHSLMLGPLLVTFIMQSRGHYFFDLITYGASSTRRVMVAFMISATLMLVFGILFYFISKAVLHHGLFTHSSDRAPSRCSPLLFLEKVGGLAMMTAAGVFSYCMVTANIMELNSGIIIMTIIGLLSVLLFATRLLSLFFSPGKGKSWWLAFRTVLGGCLFLCYFCFWLILLQLALIGSGAREGFYAAVNNLTYTRMVSVYLALGGWFLLLIATAPRVFVTKLRKEGRAPQILMASMDSLLISSFLNTAPQNGVLTNLLPQEGVKTTEASPTDSKQLVSPATTT